MSKILLTGGAGYIGSHCAVQLLQNNYEIVIFDNFSNSSLEVINRIKAITNKKPVFVEGDIRDEAALKHLFNTHSIDAVIHLAGLKAVGEAENEPLRYYDNNVNGTLKLLQAMSAAKVMKILFSSSATVYGNPGYSEITEKTHPVPINTYGNTKYTIELILQDLKKAEQAWKIGILRYFNPIGAHPSGLIGENPNGIPNNLMPFITQVASGKQKELKVFGNDYPTKDGTGVRDFIHVEDLASGHLAALEKMAKGLDFFIANLGTGRPYSVLEVIDAFERSNHIRIPYIITEKRPGDVAACYAKPDLAKKLFGWTATKTLEHMCRDSWNWQKNNPEGY